ncbi:DUF416 family protein [Georgenia sp. SUBG003]|uniref:DUF416 family protein n=1 Tax=Georgenia sp. SUBG003 TaxID=1497974 RepID=UPI003AB1FA82
MRKKTAFAVACAQRLWPLLERCAEKSAHGELDKLASALEATWLAVAGEHADLASVPALADEVMPDEDDVGWTREAGYAQNAISSIGYAASTWLTGDPQEATWAALQLYEAADYASQQLQQDIELNSGEAETALREHPVVQEALESIALDLRAVESGLDWQQLRASAQRFGDAWSKRLP